MNQIPDILYGSQERTTWLIIGASRGIGLEFVRQLLVREERIFATVREERAFHASGLWSQSFVGQLVAVPNLKIDYVVINAGVLRYPNRATEMTFEEFAFHLHTNTIGPIICAQRLLQTMIPIGTIVFMSSDSGSTQNFREMEDGFAAYAASKAALNQALRHMAAELKRKDDDTIILALHPGEVATDMANIDLAWEVEGIITPQQSVTAMIKVIESKGIQHSGTFWTWENKSRGSVDQEPLIMEVPEFIPDRRFVWKPSEPANTAANPTPPTSDDERNSRRDRRKMPKLETETLPEMRRAPSPYNFSKQTSQAHHRSSGEYLLSPDVLTPPPASSFANPPRSTPTSIPEPNILRPHVGARSASQTANSVASKPGGDSQDDESFVQRRTPARYSYTKPDADVARSSTATLHNVSSADRYNPTMSSPTLFTESPSVLSPADLPERIRSAAPPKVASRLDTTLSTRSRHYSESRSAQVSRDPSPRSSQSYYPPSPPRSPGVIASRNRDAAPRSIPDRRPSSRGTRPTSAPVYARDPRYTDGFAQKPASHDYRKGREEQDEIICSAHHETFAAMPKSGLQHQIRRLVYY
ncbi:hypothetical protein MBLNU459_g3459t3 [Dothideomycetes sp. NU459]